MVTWKVGDIKTGDAVKDTRGAVKDTRGGARPI
jgi:hypothetical protein